MAGSITVSSITLDSDNNFSILSNTGAVLVSANGSGLLTGVANTSLSNKTITNPTVSGNLSFDSTGTSGIRLPAANTLAFHTAGAEDMRIDSSGRVGIGCTPTQKLQIEDSANLIVQITKTGVASFSIVNNGTSGTILQNEANPLILSTNNTERMRIDASGRVTMPAQPAFLATSTGGITPGSGTTKVSFASVAPNIGSSFSTGTSRFTAPVAGTYLFTAIITYGTEGSATYIGAMLYKNGGNIISTYSGKATGQYSQVKISTVATLSAADYIELYTDTNSGSVIYEGGRTYLMGYLIG